MGTLRSQWDYRGMKVNGIMLGEPVQEVDEDGIVIDDGDYLWDDSALPNGRIDEDGEIIIIDEEEVIE